LLAAGTAWLLGATVVRAAPRRRLPGERAWLERSESLARAAKAHANVADFRRDIGAHRERLREIVRAAKAPPAPLAELHRSMILMNALLHAAAECHAGGKLMCPPELMQQIEHQLTVGFGQLGVLEGSA
jgi:hypothetical protein